MIVVFIRHAPDMDKSEGTYSQDVKLSPAAARELDLAIPLLVQEYGFPTEIRYSPMLRTRQTKDEMVRRLKKMNRKCKPNLKLERALSRFFTAKERAQLDVAPRTLTYRPPIVPTERSKLNVEDMFMTLAHKAKKPKHHKDVIWCITHAVVIKHIRRITEGELRPEDRAQPFLYHLGIQFTPKTEKAQPCTCPEDGAKLMQSLKKRTNTRLKL